MGIPDRSFLDIIQSKVRSWIADLSSVSCVQSGMSSDGDCTVCHDCHSRIVLPSYGLQCRCCGHIFCKKCMFVADAARFKDWGNPLEAKEWQPEFCKFCFQSVGRVGELDGVCEKQEPVVSPRQLSLDRLVHLMEVPQYPLDSLCYSAGRSSGEEEEEDDDDFGKTLLSPSSQDVSELDTRCFISGISGNELHSLKSSPSDSPNRTEHPVLQNLTLVDQESVYYPRTPRSEFEDPVDYPENGPSIFQNFQEAQKPVDLEKNGLIWLPPPPKNEADDSDSRICNYDDEDDNVGCSGIFKSCSFNHDVPSAEAYPNDAPKEFQTASVQGHFKALIAHLLRTEGISIASEDYKLCWLEVISSLAWQAANFVKPDTSRGGSMDPGDYVKVKCILTGCPSESTVVKGVVCSRNVKHKRMITQHKNPKVLILGGALEYQRAPDKLASINTVLEQETDHLKMVFSKIEAHKPNVLLVEKSVSPYVVDSMLAKGISLVANVKRSILERISRCTGARIIESTDDLPSARLGQCESFRIERVPEDCPSINQPYKKSNKTLMFLEGCPRRLGCTVLLRGTSYAELKKVKHVVQYACFAAYHLSLETSFLADEGARLPESPVHTPIIIPETCADPDDSLSTPSSSSFSDVHQVSVAELHQNGFNDKLDSPHQYPCISSADKKVYCNSSEGTELQSLSDSHKACSDLAEIFASMDLASSESHNMNSGIPWKGSPDRYIGVKPNEVELRISADDRNVMPNENFSTTENNQSILVSLSRRCILKGLTCERSQLLRIKFYGNFDKPLGRYLREDLFDQSLCCQSCKEPAEAHVVCYTHQQGSLTISVKRLPSVKLTGEHDGRIWMWHRCLKCDHEDGVPPATERVVMSDAAWGLSFGKFLELSFSNHTTANRVASCGHSLQRDCLRFYGFGSMVAAFRYAPVDILLVHLPPPILEFNSQIQQKWFLKEAMEASNKMESLFAEVFDVLHGIEQKVSSDYEPVRRGLLIRIMDFKDLLKKERIKCDAFLQQFIVENMQLNGRSSDILELNNFRRSLLINSYMWDRRIYFLENILKEKNFSVNSEPYLSGDTMLDKSTKEWINFPPCSEVDLSSERADTNSTSDISLDGESPRKFSIMDELRATESNLSDKIDLAWSGTGSNQIVKTQTLSSLETDLSNSYCQKNMSPARVYSFDSAMRNRDKTRRLTSTLSHLSSGNTLDASSEMGAIHRVSSPNIRRVYSQHTPRETQNIKFLFGHTPSFVSSTSTMMNDGARLLLPQSDDDDTFIAVYDNEPSSIISYALNSKEHMNFVAHVLDQHEKWNGSEKVKDGLFGHEAKVSAQLAPRTDFQSQLCGSDDTILSRGSLLSDPKQSHFRFSFDDDSSFPSDKAKFSVTCYFAKQFSALRKKCCPSETDYIRSLSRCKKWSAQGGKSNVYFAKTLDERFIIKQVTRTELDSFDEFAPQYFNYLTESVNSGSPTCLAKIMGIYQVTVKHIKGGREMRMELMVMENLFFGRNVSRVYDLKGSSRSRYIPDTSGSNKVLLDLNLLETLGTKPIFLGGKAKRRLERAVWNDTAFLASVDVMDYSLLVGVDDERKELVIGIIDFMRQYTWDKHLETWVKASGILGGPKNATPTVISPLQYKKRFRKAMSSYFLTVPDKWPS